MKFALLMLALISIDVRAETDEALVERLLHRPVGVAATKPAPSRVQKSDSANALIGQSVRVRTVDRGLYLGTLTAVGVDAIHLDIAVSGQTLSYALPRSAIAQLEPAAMP